MISPENQSGSPSENPRKNSNEKPCVVWITGLSAAGKSSTANALADRLKAAGKSVVALDGDLLREVFGATRSHDRASRLDLAMRYSRLCRVLASQNLLVIIATISLFREIHEFNRANLPGYFEAYLKVPIAELKRRDPKGIYRRYDAGELTNVSGLDLEIDEPENPDFLAEFDPNRTPADLAIAIESKLKEKALI